MRVAGAILIPTGIVVAGAMPWLYRACPDVSHAGRAFTDCEGANIITWPIVGVSMMVTGIVLAAVGRRRPFERLVLDGHGQQGPREGVASASGGTMVHSPGLAYGGYALLGLGVTSIAAGAVVFARGDAGCSSVCGEGKAIGAALMIHGAGAIAGGVPMVVVGVRKIPVPVVAPLVLPPPPAAPARGAAPPVGLAIAGAF